MAAGIGNGAGIGSFVESRAGTLGCILAVCGWSLPAAASPRHALQATADLAVQSARDDTLVPLAHTGPRLSFGARYFGDFGVELLLADVRLGMGVVAGAAGELGLTALWGLTLSPLFRISETPRGVVYLGPALSFDGDVFYFGDWDDAHAYWIGARWVGLRAYGSHPLDARWRLDWDARASLFGAVARPPAYRHAKQEVSDDVPGFFSWAAHGTEPGFLWDFQVLGLALDLYRQNGGQRVPSGWGFGSNLSFVRAPEPAPVFSFALGARVSRAWSF